MNGEGKPRNGCRVALRLEQLGVRTRHGQTRWNRVTIWGMLRNSAYGRPRTAAVFLVVELGPKGQLLSGLTGFSPLTTIIVTAGLRFGGSVARAVYGQWKVVTHGRAVSHS